MRSGDETSNYRYFQAFPINCSFHGFFSCNSLIPRFFWRGEPGNKVTSFPLSSPPLSLSSHIVEVEVLGPGHDGNHFTVHTVRTNPASSGVVTGKQTYASFLSSMLGKG